MKLRVVQWTIFIIFYLLSERAFISSSQAAFHDLKPLMNRKQLISDFKNHETTIKGLHEEELHLKVVEREKKEIINDENKKGKGSTGGGDLLRPRARKGGANSLQSTTLLGFVLLGLLLTLFFF